MGEAVGDARDTVAHVAEAGATATVRFSAEAFANAKAAGEGLSQRVTEWLPRSQKTRPELTRTALSNKGAEAQPLRRFPSLACFRS